jgi:hypothetical protein
MKFRQAILLFIIFSILTSCRRGYKIEGNNVYWEHWNEGSGQNKDFIDDADAKTFQKLKFDCDCDFKFAKDKNHLYIDGEPIRDIDPNSFRFIGNYVFRDTDSAYFFGAYNNINNCAIKGVDPDKIKLISYPWAKSDNLLIHGYDTLSLNDISDFLPINEDWGKTKKYVINKSEILSGADPATFKVINSYSGKDKNHTYEFGEIKE